MVSPHGPWPNSYFIKIHPWHPLAICRKSCHFYRSQGDLERNKGSSIFFLFLHLCASTSISCHSFLLDGYSGYNQPWDWHGPCLPTPRGHHMPGPSRHDWLPLATLCQSSWESPNPWMTKGSNMDQSAPPEVCQVQMKLRDDLVTWMLWYIPSLCKNHVSRGVCA